MVRAKLSLVLLAAQQLNKCCVCFNVRHLRAHARELAWYRSCNGSQAARGAACVVHVCACVCVYSIMLSCAHRASERQKQRQGKQKHTRTNDYSFSYCAQKVVLSVPCAYDVSARAGARSAACVLLAVCLSVSLVVV